MSKSNWKGSSGWGAIDDPTGVLNGRVLVGAAGVSVKCSTKGLIQVDYIH